MDVNVSQIFKHECIPNKTRQFAEPAIYQYVGMEKSPEKIQWY